MMQSMESALRGMWFVLMVGVAVFAAYGQEAAVATGGDATGSGGTAAYSVGQAAYTFHNAKEGNIQAGVQQAYHLDPVGWEALVNNFHITVYPNPVNERLTLRVGDEPQERLSYQLIDVNGKLLAEAFIETKETYIITEHLPFGTYLLNVAQGNKVVHAVKIIKYK